MHSKEINIKNQVYYHYENLIKSKDLETRNNFVDNKIYNSLVIYITD